MIRGRNLFTALLVIAVLMPVLEVRSAGDPLTTNAAPEAQPADDPLTTAIANVVQVRAYRDEKLQAVVSGFSVHDGKTVLTSGHALRHANRITVTSSDAGAEITARLVRRDDARDLALLQAPDLDAEPFVVAANSLERGRRVVTAWRQEADGQVKIARGSIGAAPVPGQADVFYEHNAMITADGYGAPLLDECGRVAGINRKNPQDRLFFWNTRADDPDSVVYAGTASDLLALLSEEGVPHNAETTVCTPREQVAQVARAEAEAEAAQARQEAEEAQRVAQVARAEAEAIAAEAEAEATQARQEAEEAQQVAEEAQQRADLSEAEKAALQRRAEEKEQAASEAEERVRALEQKATRQAEQTRRYLYIGGAGVVLLAFLVIFLFIWRGRVARRLVAKAEEAKQRAETPPDPDSRPGWSFRDESGADSFYVSMAVLEAVTQGVRVGRNPDSCNCVINAPEISREHCRIFLSNGRLMLEDLKSANGTRIGARSLEAHNPDEIHEGDRITLGESIFQVTYSAK